MTNNPTFDAWFAAIPGTDRIVAPDAAATTAIAASERPQEAAFSLTAPRVRAALAVFTSIFGVRPSIRVTRAAAGVDTLFPAVLTLTSGEGALFLSTGDATGTRPYAVIGLRSPEGVLFTPKHPALAAIESAILMRPEVGGVLLNDVQVLGLGALKADREALAHAALHALTISETPEEARNAVWLELLDALGAAQFGILGLDGNARDAAEVAAASAFILAVRSRSAVLEVPPDLASQAVAVSQAGTLGGIIRRAAVSLVPALASGQEGGLPQAKTPDTDSKVADKDVLS